MVAVIADRTDRDRARERGRDGARPARPADGAPRREPGDARPATCCSSCSSSKRRSRACIFVAVDENGSLRRMLEHASSAPVLRRQRAAASSALQCAKLFGVEDTVLFGRTLLMQANARSAVLPRAMPRCSSRSRQGANAWLNERLRALASRCATTS